MALSGTRERGREGVDPSIEILSAQTAPTMCLLGVTSHDELEPGEVIQNGSCRAATCVRVRSWPRATARMSPVAYIVANMNGELEPRLIIRGDGDEPFVSGEFFIAAYQRGYRWGQTEVSQLLEDIKKNAIKERQEYLLQPIVVLPGKKADSWELIDGQQRLTTLYLILKYISTHLPFATIDYALTYETRASSREFLDSIGTPDAESRRSDNIDFHHMFEAYAVIEAWFGEQGNTPKAASDFHSALSEFVKVIWYQAPEGTVANELFARLNVARIPLTDAELVKALILSGSARGGTGTNRQEQVAAQWDSFERDLRDPDFWAFLNGSATSRSTHIDFLFESMTQPPPGRSIRPRYWTFGEVQEQIDKTSPEAFWRRVVERHGLLIGWFQDRNLYHYVGYLTATGDSISALLDAAVDLTHSECGEMLVERIRSRLNLTRYQIETLRYGNGSDEKQLTRLLLLMNVETTRRQGVRFSFHEFASAKLGGPWSLEHIHAQNAQGQGTEPHWRAWLEHHLEEIKRTRWETADATEANRLEAEMTALLAKPKVQHDETLATAIIRLFSATEDVESDEELHGIENLALLQRDLNSELNDAVFSLKRRRVLEHDFNGDYIPPCTRNVFLKYYSATDGQGLHLWGPQDRDAYVSALFELVEPYLVPESSEAA